MLARAEGPPHIGNCMVTNKREQTLNRVFGALADPTRRAILARLSRGEATVGELSEPFDISRPAISKHLDVLEQAGLVHRIPDGRGNRCRLDADPLRRALPPIERDPRPPEPPPDA